MVFNSLTFVVFFAIVLGLHSLPFSWTVKKTNLLLASYIFYAAWSPPFVVLLWITTLVDFFVAKLIFRTEKKVKRRLLFLISLAEPRELRRRPGQADTGTRWKSSACMFPNGWKNLGDQRKGLSQERVLGFSGVARLRGTWIHFTAYPSLSGYNLPDWSHLDSDGRSKFTKGLTDILIKGTPSGTRPIMSTSIGPSWRSEKLERVRLRAPTPLAHRFTRQTLL
jgi:hypothetical protein